MNVFGVRNIPCETNPAKRAATVEQCESNEEYVPLNDGFNWKGDPNATLSGQGVPQYAPGQVMDPNCVVCCGEVRVIAATNDTVDRVAPWLPVTPARS